MGQISKKDSLAIIQLLANLEDDKNKDTLLKTQIEINGEKYDLILAGKRPEQVLEDMITGIAVLSDLEKLEQKKEEQQLGTGTEIADAFLAQFQRAGEMRESGEIIPETPKKDV